MKFQYPLALAFAGFLPGSHLRSSHFFGDGTCQNIAVGGEVVVWEPTELCGGQHRGGFGRSSGFSTHLVGMVLVLVANAISYLYFNRFNRFDPNFQSIHMPCNRNRGVDLLLNLLEY